MVESSPRLLLNLISRRVPDFGILSLDLDTVKLGRFFQDFFWTWMILRKDLDLIGFSKDLVLGFFQLVLDDWKTKIIGRSLIL